jgi:hypothetical protein
MRGALLTRLREAAPRLRVPHAASLYKSRRWIVAGALPILAGYAVYEWSEARFGYPRALRTARAAPASATPAPHSAWLSSVAPAAAAAEPESKFYSFTVNDIHGKPRALSEFRGKVVLVVNTASECGFTKQYADLQALFDKYSKDGLVVLGFPSNSHGLLSGQEPGSEVGFGGRAASSSNAHSAEFAPALE